MELFFNDWDEILQEEINKPYFNNIVSFLEIEYQKKHIYPPKEKILSALKYTSYKDTKVLILVQDPYHGFNQAMGLAFSVNYGVKIPPSLINIYKEMESDVHTYMPDNGNLIPLAKQGVLLLNTVLTVEENKPNSHANIGWQIFTDEIIKILNNKVEPMVFILWGNNAKKKKPYITNGKHLIIESAHPSPLSAYNGFFGSHPFSRCNDFLISNGQKPVDWQIPSSYKMEAE